jgi:hypothetical protein
MCRAGPGADGRARRIALEESMRIKRSTAGRHRRPARAILPSVLALVLAGLALTGIIATAAATHLSAMHYFG